jgi:hypothetical protein
MRTNCDGQMRETFGFMLKHPTTDAMFPHNKVRSGLPRRSPHASFDRPRPAARPRLIRLDTRMTAHAGCSHCGCGASAASSSPRRIEAIGTRRRLAPTARASCA